MSKAPVLSDIAANGFAAITTYNTNQDNIETAFANTISRDGSTPNSMEAEFDMNSNKIINVLNPVQPQDGATKDYVDTLFSAIVDPNYINTVLAGLSGQLTNVSTLVELKAATSNDPMIYCGGRRALDDGYAGIFTWQSGDKSAEVANDPANIIWVAPDSDPTGASGAYKRMNGDFGYIDVRWAGAVAADIAASTYYADLAAIQVDYPHALATTDKMDWLAVQAVIDAYPGRTAYMPESVGIYRWNRGIKIYSNKTSIKGAGPGLTYIYFANATETCIYCGPEDYVATANATRNFITDLQIASTAVNPTNIGIEFRQVLSGRINNVDMFGFPKSVLTAGGTGNTYCDIDARADVADTPPSGSYVMKFCASDRGANGWQPTYSHQIDRTYLSAEGELDCVLEIGMGDGLQFTNSYWKGGVNGIFINPDGGNYGVRVEFTNVYFDGKAGVTVYGLYIPAFNQAGQNIGMVTFDGCLIANCDQGSNVYIENPTAGGVNFITFNGTTFGNCLEGCFDVTNTARDLNLVIDGCTIRDCGGGIGINGIGTLTVSNTVFEDVRNNSGIDHIDLTGTINSVIFKDNTVKLRSSSAAALITDSATVGRFILKNNPVSSGSIDLMMRSKTIADDGVSALFIPLGTNEPAAMKIFSYTGVGYGEIFFRDGGLTTVMSGTLSAVSDTNLTGTTGVDTAVTCSYDDSAESFIIENRSGASRKFYYERIL